MKTRTIIFTAALLLVSFASLHAQTVDGIITKHIEKIGGKDLWRKVNSLRIHGTMTAQGTEITVVVSGIQNKGMRQDITVMGMSGYSILTPTAGWSFMPFAGQKQAEALTADDVKESQDDLDLQGELLDYKDKGHTAELLGKEDVEGTECYKIKLTLKNGKTKTMFIDPESYYLIREVKKQKANGQEQETITNFSNFQKLPEGIVVPMTIGTGAGEVNCKQYEINPKIDESIFKAG